MAGTTKDNVLAIAPELASIAQATWDLVLADVVLSVGANWGQKQELGQRYLAAHRLTLIQKKDKGGQVTSERTGDVSTSYGVEAKNNLSETVYGRQFERIRQGTIAGFMTVTP